MRYIRTNDNNHLIIDTTNIQIPHNITDEFIDFNSFGFFKIIKQADTIEELCDEFISVGGKSLGSHFRTDGYGLTNLLNQSELHKSILKELQGQGHRYYGAIWITGENGEPILKSVAKMNDKGVLELL